MRSHLVRLARLRRLALFAFASMAVLIVGASQASAAYDVTIVPGPLGPNPVPRVGTLYQPTASGQFIYEDDLEAELQSRGVITINTRTGGVEFGDITVAGGVEIVAPDGYLVLQAPFVGSTVDVPSFDLFGFNAAGDQFKINAPSGLTALGSISINGASELLSSATFTASNLDLGTLDGSPFFQSNVSGTVTFNGSIGADVPLGGMLTNSNLVFGGAVGTVDATGMLAFTDATSTIAVQGNTAFTSGDVIQVAGPIAAGSNDLSLDAASNTSVAAITAGVVSFTSLTSTAVSGDVNATSIDVEDDTLIYGADVTVTTTGTQTYDDVSVETGRLATFAAGSSAVTIDGFLDGPGAAAINTTDVGTVTGLVGPNSALASFSTNAGGSTLVGSSIDSSGSITIGDTLELQTALTTLNGTAASLDDVTGSTRNLIVNSSGETRFGGALGVNGASLGTVETDNAGFTTLGTGADGAFVDVVTFGDDVHIDGASTTITADDSIAFADRLDGLFGLTLDAPNDTTFSSFVGSADALTSLNVNNGRAVAAADITTSGDQDYAGGISLLGTSSLTASGVGSFISSTGLVDVNDGDTLTVDGAGSFANGVAGTGGTDASLVKQGDADDVLTLAASSYTGATTISGGTVHLNGTSDSAVELDGGTLTGLSGSAVNGISSISGGWISPGTPAGSIAAIGSASIILDSDTAFAASIDGATVDQLSVTGTVTLGGAVLDLGIDTAPAVASARTIIANDGADAVTGTFAGLAEGATVSLGGNAYEISYVGGSGNDVTVTRLAYVTTATLTAAPVGTATFGSSVTFTATLSSTGGTPTGTVTFSDNGVPFGGARVVNGSGVATVSTSALAIGSHTILATYGGDGTFGGDTDTIVYSVTQQASATALAQSSTTTERGGAVTFTATVNVASGTPTGTVEFRDGAGTFATVPVTGAGTASATTTTLTTGAHAAITAVYGGDADSAASTSSPVSHTVNKRTTSTALTLSSTTGVDGSSVTFTAAPTSAGVFAGSVTLRDGAATLGSVTVGAGGTAAYSTSTLAVGSHSITATYEGDADNAASTSAAMTYTVTKAQVAEEGIVRITRVSASGSCISDSRRDVAIRFRLANTARVSYKLERRTRPAPRPVSTCPSGKPTSSSSSVTPAFKQIAGKVSTLRRGLRAIRVSQLVNTAKLAPGVYRLRVQAIEADGDKSRTFSIFFTVTQ